MVTRVTISENFEVRDLKISIRLCKINADARRDGQGWDELICMVAVAVLAFVLCDELCLVGLAWMSVLDGDSESDDQQQPESEQNKEAPTTPTLCPVLANLSVLSHENLLAHETAQVLRGNVWHDWHAVREHTATKLALKSFSSPIIRAYANPKASKKDAMPSSQYRLSGWEGTHTGIKVLKVQSETHNDKEWPPPTSWYERETNQFV